jgi:hypothetical protein
MAKVAYACSGVSRLGNPFGADEQALFVSFFCNFQTMIFPSLVLPLVLQVLDS